MDDDIFDDFDKHGVKKEPHYDAARYTHGFDDDWSVTGSYYRVGFKRPHITRDISGFIPLHDTVVLPDPSVRTTIIVNNGKLSDPYPLYSCFAVGNTPYRLKGIFGINVWCGYRQDNPEKKKYTYGGFPGHVLTAKRWFKLHVSSIKSMLH